MEKKLKDAVTAAFIADALSLGVHWVYRTSDIEQRYGRLEEMVAPELAPFHKAKQKGEFTHYGDQMMVLLESAVHASGFDLEDFSSRWQKLFAAYTGYMDHATKDTLINIKNGKTPEKCGSQSTDLAGASRLVPLALCYSGNEDGFVLAARQQTAMTHNSPLVVNTAEWFARVTARVLEGQAPSMAVFSALEAMPDTFGMDKLVAAGYDSRADDTPKAIAGFGAMCEINAALPSSVHLMVKYEDNLKEGLVENIMAGGDSSARGVMAGFTIACHSGIQTLPQKWFDDMKAGKRIRELISALA